MTYKTETIKLKNRKKYVVTEVSFLWFKFSIFNGCGRINLRFSIDIGKEW